jgi:hypothetical protein
MHDLFPYIMANQIIVVYNVVYHDVSFPIVYIYSHSL